jgi:hypothetical protein
MSQTVPQMPPHSFTDTFTDTEKDAITDNKKDTAIYTTIIGPFAAYITVAPATTSVDLPKAELSTATNTAPVNENKVVTALEAES